MNKYPKKVLVELLGVEMEFVIDFKRPEGYGLGYLPHYYLYLDGEEIARTATYELAMHEAKMHIRFLESSKGIDHE